MSATWNYPKGLPARYRWHWDHAWTARARNHPGFRRWLAQHGYLSPHFRASEAASKDGRPVPARLMGNARRHAWNLEKLRHAIGDKPVRVLSWYRSPERNRAVGGAAKSKHMEALATDHDVSWVRAQPGFDGKADRIFAKGGFGQYPGGNRHMDSRSGWARWTSFTPGR